MIDIDKESKKPYTSTYYLSSEGLKRKVQILIDDQLFREALEISSKIYGKSRGGLSLLISTLLRDFIEQYKTKNIVLGDPRKSIKEVFMEVLENIAEKRKCSISEIHEVTEKELVQAIANVRGSDKRTVFRKVYKCWGPFFIIM
ncbi:MAG: hypothetical protein QXJ97_09865 [Desulfurococcaceae archaeon]